MAGRIRLDVRAAPPGGPAGGGAQPPIAPRRPPAGGRHRHRARRQRSIPPTAGSPASTSRSRCCARRGGTSATAARATSRCRWMDATSLAFPDESFDVVYAAYVISVVPDPVQALQEMARVCRPHGRIVLLNHFRSTTPWMANAERLMAARGRAGRDSHRPPTCRPCWPRRACERNRSERSTSRGCGRSSSASVSTGPEH